MNVFVWMKSDERRFCGVMKALLLLLFCFDRKRCGCDHFVAESFFLHRVEFLLHFIRTFLRVTKKTSRPNQTALIQKLMCLQFINQSRNFSVHPRTQGRTFLTLIINNIYLILFWAIKTTTLVRSFFIAIKCNARSNQSCKPAPLGIY